LKTEVVRLKLGEGARLRAIRLRALRDAPDAFASTYEEAAALPPESWSDQLRRLVTFVAVRENSDVGLVRCAPDDTRPDTAWLISMWVAPEARGHGVGERLIDAAVDWARAEGATRVLLDVADDNRPAIALYARKGFEPNGEVSTLPPPRQHIREHQRELKLL
jgi:ribosomal protein S18 acetylase RimI-like enzyme